MNYGSRSRSEALVLGGGVIGLASALALLRGGRSVTLLERQSVGSGASHGNCGTITPSHLPLTAPGTIARGLKSLLKADAPLRIKPRLDPALLSWLLNFARRCNSADYRHASAVKVRLLQASRARLSALIAEENLECEFVEGGTMYVWRNARAFEESLGEFQLLQSLGIEVQRLDGAATQLKEPALNSSVIGGHFHPGDARLRPDRYVAELARAVRAAGGNILEQAEILGFHVDAGKITSVETSQGGFEGDEIVFALGAWSPLIGRQLGLRLPVQPGKGYSITYSRPGRAPAIPLVLKERSVCVTSWTSGYRLGSTMEFAGYDASLNRTRLDALGRGAAEYLIEPLGRRIEEEWYGWRPMTPDDLPIIGRAPNLSNLILATGHGMLGITLSAITALLVTELLNHRPASIDLADYSPTRF